MSIKQFTPSILLHSLSPRGLAIAAFVMVFVSIAAPAAYLYCLGLDLPVDLADTVHDERIRTAGWVLLPLMVILSLVLAHFAAQLRRRSLGLVAQMQVVEEKLREQIDKVEKANQEKSELLAVATHDLKNPLSAIVGMSDILLDMKRSAPDQEAVKEDIEIIESINTSAGHMFEIVRGILANERFQLGRSKVNRTTVNLAEVCHETVKSNNTLANKKTITIRTEITVELSLNGDRALLQEALDHYISNAIKYSPAGKNVTVSLGRDPTGAAAEIAVQDEGPGISVADQAKLFGKFKKLTARPTAGEISTGLGLPIVKTIVELHQGTVGCDSRPGQGCRFWMRLPLESPSPQK